MPTSTPIKQVTQNPVDDAAIETQRATLKALALRKSILNQAKALAKDPAVSLDDIIERAVALDRSSAKFLVSVFIREREKEKGS